MKLIFDIIKNSNNNNVSNKHNFDKTGGSIGRADDVSWQLEDKDNYISGIHLLIEYNNNKYYAKDISTNGTYLKFPYKKLPNNDPIEINNTDIFIIGGYEIQARFFNNEYTQNDLVNKKIDIDSDFTSTLSNNNSNRNIIPDDFSLLDDNNTNTLVDDIEVEEKDDNILNSFDDIKIKNEKTVNDMYELNNNAFEDEYIEETSVSNNTLNEHIVLPTFEEKIEETVEEPSEEIIEEIKEVKVTPRLVQNDDSSNIMSSVDKINEMQALSSLMVLEQKLGINIVNLTQYERDIVLSEISNIVLNSLEGIKQTLDTNDIIKDDILKNKKKDNKNVNEKNPIRAGQHVINILDISNESEIKISDAISKSFNEINVHNIALHKSSKSLLNLTLKKFSPEYIEFSFKQRARTLPFIPQNIQMWKEYKKHYASLVEEDKGQYDLERDFLKEYKKESNSVDLTKYQKENL